VGVAEPGGRDVAEADALGVNVKFAGGGVRVDLLQSVDENAVRRNSGGAENCDRAAAQDGGGKRDGWSGAFANLDEASLGSDGGKFFACHGREKSLRRATPEVIDHDLKT
jgi:hypothetical protein